MRTTVDLDDGLFRRAKAEAALRGLRFRELVEEGLQWVLASPNSEIKMAKPPPTLYELMKSSLGIVDSGIEDLATNPKHLKGMGSDSMGNR